MDILKKIYETGIVPVIKIDNADKAQPLAAALIAGGISVAEITFRTDAAEEAIRRISSSYPDMLTGAGTVLNVEQCKRAVAAGASFIVTPGYNSDVVDYCIENGIIVLPGCANASDLTRAANAGLKVVKFFPAEQSGGIAYLKAVAPVFSSLRFMPTGGINQANLNEYLSFNKIFACGGSWMVKADLINNDRFDEITSLCKGAVRSMLNLKLAHVGINCADDKAALQTANMFSLLIGADCKHGNSSIFVSDTVEVYKFPFRGHCGHIAVSTTNIDRAIAYFENLGYSFDETSKKADASGHTTLIYFADEFGGFAVHLVEKKG